MNLFPYFLLLLCAFCINAEDGGKEIKEDDERGFLFGKRLADPCKAGPGNCICRRECNRGRIPDFTRACVNPPRTCCCLPGPSDTPEPTTVEPPTTSEPTTEEPPTPSPPITDCKSSPGNCICRRECRRDRFHDITLQCKSPRRICCCKSPPPATTQSQS